jgi:hypothetical protein
MVNSDAVSIGFGSELTSQLSDFLSTAAAASAGGEGGSGQPHAHAHSLAQTNNNHVDLKVAAAALQHAHNRSSTMSPNAPNKSPSSAFQLTCNQLTMSGDAHLDVPKTSPPLDIVNLAAEEIKRPATTSQTETSPKVRKTKFLFLKQQISSAKTLCDKECFSQPFLLLLQVTLFLFCRDAFFSFQIFRTFLTFASKRQEPNRSTYFISIRVHHGTQKRVFLAIFHFWQETFIQHSKNVAEICANIFPTDC